MIPKKNWIHFEKAELAVVFIVLILSHGLLYVLGVLTGFGFNSTHNPATEVAVEQHGSSVAGHGEHGDRSPAALKEKNSGAHGEEAGLALKKAFKESKQQALNELVLRKTVVGQRPKSIENVEAHFNGSDWGKVSDAAAIVTGNVEKPDEHKRGPASIPAPQKEKVVESQSAVKSLFERRPSALENFLPKPGAFAVQIASYATPEEAQAKVVELRKAGFNEAFIQNARNAGGSEWHRVAVGSFPTKAWAQKTGEKIIHRKLAHDFIVRQVP